MPAAPFDPRKATTSIACAVMACKRTDLYSWLDAGAPGVRDERGRLSIDLPAMIAWRIDRERGCTAPAAAIDDATISDAELARRALRAAMAGDNELARVQAAKTVLAEQADEIDEESSSEVVAFIEIQNVAGVISAAGASAPCPRCGCVVKMP